MYIPVTYKQDFDDLIMYLKSKYPDKLFDLEGIGKQLDMSEFSKKFFASNVTADASIDANANVDDISVIAYDKELPKPWLKLNSYYVLWNELVKLHGRAVANDVIERQLIGDIYINDFHGVAAGKPYSYHPHTLVTVKNPQGEIIYTTMEDLFEIVKETGDATLTTTEDAEFYSTVGLGWMIYDDVESGWSELHCVTRHVPHCTMRGLETKNGKSMIVTADHPVIVENSDGTTSKKLAQDMTTDDVMAQPDMPCIPFVALTRQCIVEDAYQIGASLTSYTSKFPANILCWTTRSIKAAIAGVFDAIGTIRPNGMCSVRAMSLALAQQIRDLCEALNLGAVRATVALRAENRKTTPRYCVDIYFTDREMMELSEKIAANQEVIYNATKQGACFDRGDRQLYQKCVIHAPDWVYDVTTSTGHFVGHGLKLCNCFNYSAYDVMNQGLSTVKKIRCLSPKYLHAFKQQIEQFVTLASNSTLGATGLADLFVVMSYYVKNIITTLSDAHFKLASKEDAWQYVREHIVSLIYTLNQPMRANQCVTEDTEVLTPNGFKKYYELKAGDPIYTWHDGELNVQPVQAVNVYDYDGDMHEYRGRDVVEVVTPNHRVLRRSLTVGDKAHYELQTSASIFAAPILGDTNKHSHVSIPVAMDTSDRPDYPIGDKDLIDALYAFDGSCPNWLFLLSKRQAELALRAMCYNESLDDGVHCKTQEFADTVQHLYFLAGKGSTIEVHSSDEYAYHVVQMKETDAYASALNVIHYTSKVWCPTTEDGIVVFRKENKLFISGNSPFTNVSIYDDVFLDKLCADYVFPDGSSPDKEIVKRLQEMYLDVMNEELARTPITFPVTTACFSINENHEIQDEAFLRMIAEKNLPWAFINLYAGSSSTLSSCCRLRSEQQSEYFNSFGSGSSKIGSLGVVTINLPRLAIKYPLEEDFLEELKKMVGICAMINHAKRSIVKKRIKNGNEPLYTQGFAELSKQYSTVGVNGFYEALKFLGKDILTKEGQALGLRILDVINTTNKFYQNTFHAPHNVEQVPGENLSIKLAEKDKLLGYQDEYDLYSNQFIPLISNADLFDRIKLQGLFDSHFSGGAICHLNAETRVENVEDMMNLIRTAAKKGVVYFAINYVLAQCEDGHMSVTHGDKCEICGKPIVDQFTRVVGFLTNVKNWHQVRREDDYPNRQFYQGADIHEPEADTEGAA